MRRALVTVAVFLLLGAIVNVAVAWGSIELAIPSRWGAQSEDQIPENELEALWRRYGDPRSRRVSHGWRRDNSMITLLWIGNNIQEFKGRPGAVMSGGRNLDVTIVMCGWPCRYLTHVQRNDVWSRLQALNKPGNRTIIHWFSESRVNWVFAGTNTVFYATVLFGAIFGFAQTRRTIRLRRGRCPKCAYDLRGTDHERCPECGATK